MAMAQQFVPYTKPDMVPEAADDSKPQEKSAFALQLQRFVTPGNLFIAAGSLLLTMLSIVPMWNAADLLNDANYVFWEGRRVPHLMIFSCIFIIVLFIGTMVLFFRRSKLEARTEQSITMIATIFITLVGLALMIVSVPLELQVMHTYNNLLYRCDVSEQTHRLYEYSQVLQTIRATPACAKEYSVEQCAGYSAAPPYTNFLKTMETELRCAGFCYRKLGKAGNATAAKKTKAALLATRGHMKKRHGERVMLITDAAEVEERSFESDDMLIEEASAPTYPPTLFSDKKFQASCESMAARDLQNTAGDISNQTQCLGVYLVAMAVITGFLKLVGQCFRKRDP